MKTTKEISNALLYNEFEHYISIALSKNDYYLNLNIIKNETEIPLYTAFENNELDMHTILIYIGTSENDYVFFKYIWLTNGYFYTDLYLADKNDIKIYKNYFIAKQNNEISIKFLNIKNNIKVLKNMIKFFFK